MQPTQHSLRLTPKMATAMARIWVEHDLKDELSLNEEQRTRIAEIAARQAMDFGHHNGADLQAMIEYFLASAIGGPGQNKWSPEQGREFAERTQPLIRASRDMLKRFRQDVSPILSADQMRQFEDNLRKASDGLDKFEERMNRWADGRMEPGENPFNERRNQRGATPEERRKNRREQRLQRMERRLTNVIEDHGPKAWEQFWAGAKEFFKLDETQCAQGDALLADYTKRAEAIMTDDWKDRARHNRLKRQYTRGLRDQPIAPWIYHLNWEFHNMVQPLDDLGQAFRNEIMNLVTRDQRQAAVQQLRNLAREKGLLPDDVELQVPGLTNE
jgi:hypothetical protein